MLRTSSAPPSGPPKNSATLGLKTSKSFRPSDIRDVMYLAQAGLIVKKTLISRFEAELEPYITGRTPTWNRTTLKMWVDACWPE